MPERTGGKRILIVEDEKVVADTLGQILSANGYGIRIAYSAKTPSKLFRIGRRTLQFSMSCFLK